MEDRLVEPEGCNFHGDDPTQEKTSVWITLAVLSRAAKEAPEYVISCLNMLLAMKLLTTWDVILKRTNKK